MVVALAFVVGFLISGLWIQYFGFAEPLWFTLGCQAAALLYFILLLPESRAKTEDSRKLFSLAGLRFVKNVIYRSVLCVLYKCTASRELVLYLYRFKQERPGRGVSTLFVVLSTATAFPIDQFVKNTKLY